MGFVGDNSLHVIKMIYIKNKHKHKSCKAHILLKLKHISTFQCNLHSAKMTPGQSGRMGKVGERRGGGVVRLRSGSKVPVYIRVGDIVW